MTCPHNNVQQFTEICLDCGVNIYETPEERVRRLRTEVNSLRQQALQEEGDALEEERARLRRALQKDPEPTTNW